MKSAILLVVIVLTAANPMDHYVTEDDNLDIASIMASPDEMQGYLNCFLDKVPCTKVAESYKVHIIEAVKQACLRCSHNQKNMFWQFLQGLKMLPDDYDKFRQKYDPDNKYFQDLEEELNKYKVPVPYVPSINI